MSEELEKLKATLEGLKRSSPKNFNKKLDKILKVFGFKNVECIRTYSTTIEKLIISSRERGEEPQLLVLRTFNKKRGTEYQIVFIGKHHVENLSYFKTNPKFWNSERFGYVVLTPQEFVDLRDIMNRVNVKFEIEFLEAKRYFWFLRFALN